MRNIENSTPEVLYSDERLEIMETCKVALGYPVISLFITDEQINTLINMAVRKCASKACPTFTATRYNVSGVLNISDLGVETVRNVYKAEVNSAALEGTTDCSGSCSSYGDGCNICEKLCTHRFYGEMTKSEWSNSMYDMFAYQYSKSELQKQQLSDWYQDGDLLYLDNYEGLVTIEYTKGCVTLEDLKNDSHWFAWVEQYVLALVKITEGRVRGKYKLSSGVFEVEADELVSEGNSDKQELEEKLNEDIGYWNIMR